MYVLYYTKWGNVRSKQNHHQKIRDICAFSPQWSILKNDSLWCNHWRPNNATEQRILGTRWGSVVCPGRKKRGDVGWTIPQHSWQAVTRERRLWLGATREKRKLKGQKSVNLRCHHSKQEAFYFWEKDIMYTSSLNTGKHTMSVHCTCRK